MLSEGSLRGMRKRSLEWLSILRSAVVGVPREYRLIGAFDSADVFCVQGRRGVNGRREGRFGHVGGRGQCGGRGREEEDESGCGKVGS